MRRSFRLALLACVALVAGLVPAAAQAQTDGLRLATVKHSRLGTHDWYQQTRDGVPVLGGYLARHYDTAGRLVRVDDGRLAASGLASLSPSVSADSAKAGTSRHGAGTPRAATLAVRPGSPARLVWAVLASTSRGTTRTLVDAGTGAVVESRSMVKEANGRGRSRRPTAAGRCSTPTRWSRCRTRA
jgi:Zn-dependent metalloprotease